MLASYRQRQFHDSSAFANHLGNSSSGLPFHCNNFQSHIPTAAGWDQGFHTPRFTLGNAPPSPSSESSDASDYIMSDHTHQLQNPPIRLHRPSPVLHAAGAASPRQSAAHDWVLYKDMVAQGAQAGQQHEYGSRRISHQRASSGSSVNSAGPPSPYESTVSQPFIVQPDTPSTHSVFLDAAQAGEQGAHFGMPKPLPTPSHTPQRDSFLAPEFQNYNPDTEDSESNQETKRAMLRALEEQRNCGSDTLPAPRPLAGSFSIVDRISPPTPSSTVTEVNDGGARRRRTDCATVPKLDRTMSDVYQDELFNPTIYTTAAPNQAPRPAPCNNQDLLSPYRNVFSERIRAANQGHIRAKSIPPAASVTREKSPFRQGSPYAPSMARFGGRSPQTGLQVAAQSAHQAHVSADASLAPGDDAAEDAETVKTISPKDALLEYHESDEDAKAPLFPQSAPTDTIAQHGGTENSYDQFNHIKMENDSQYSTAPEASQQPIFTFAPAPQQPSDMQVLQQYPFVPRPAGEYSLSQVAEQVPQFPARLVSMESTVSENDSRDVQRPARTAADGGTYTCTYHGCTRRFETPAKLQKHKREGHRQAFSRTGLMGTLEGGVASTAAVIASARNGQAGPHRCERINPSTGKPCNTIFSRPYDLTRHEDTIHNGGRQKVRCRYCTEDKMFSRNDALTRHMRVVHPDIDFGAKSRRRQQLSS